MPGAPVPAERTIVVDRATLHAQRGASEAVPVQTQPAAMDRTVHDTARVPARASPAPAPAPAPVRPAVSAAQAIPGALPERPPRVTVASELPTAQPVRPGRERDPRQSDESPIPRRAERPAPAAPPRAAPRAPYVRAMQPPAAYRAAAPARAAAAVTQRAALAPVHVTIGRIEVRAAPAAPASRREHTGAPKLTLDDYLRQREGGAR
jgi:hypothetical protein